ncbi:hypothetical protein HDU81_009413 [Chytriomyces hyalinus]|nr:hypothetical protein HDU81_009413 [Chytriomyces hyalinus]
MRFTFTLFALVSAVLAQTTEPAAPSSPAPAAPSTSGKQSITIISPTGNKAYNAGESMTITWTNNADATDVDYQYTDITFELADASGGANKVTPLGLYFDTVGKNASVGLLEVTAPVPSGVKPGPAYCVRANIKGATGFTYYFSPTFPVGMAIGDVPKTSGNVAAASPTAAGAAGGAGAGAASVSAGSLPTTAAKSGAGSLTALFVVSSITLFIM